MLKPQKDTVLASIEVANKQYEVKKALAVALYFYLSTYGGRQEDNIKYDRLKTELMDLHIHISVLKDLLKEAE